MRTLTLLFSILLSTIAAAQQPLQFLPHEPIVLSVQKPAPVPNLPAPKTKVIWYSNSESCEVLPGSDDKTVAHVWAAPGNYTVTAMITSVFVDWEKQEFDLTVSDQKFIFTVAGTPVPPGPTPPGPTPPGPTPPGPVPTEDESINPAGLTVLILKEAEDFSYPEKTLQVLNSTKIQAYLNSKTVKGPDGYPGWRQWDDDYSDENLSGHAEYWKKAYRKALEKAQTKRPWLFISTPAKSFNYDISDKTETEVLNILKLHGGN